MANGRLLILGSVEDFTGLTRYAVERGIYTVVADGYAGEAKRYATKAYTVDLQDQALIDLIIREERIDHVLSSYSDNLFEQMVYVSDRNGLPCYCGADKVRYLRDKIKMKEMLRELDIGTARGQILKGSLPAEDQIEIPFPCALKPLDGWGSKGVRIVRDYRELKAYFERTSGFSTSGTRAMLEEINPGHEINVMSWIKDRGVSFMEFGDRETSGATDVSLPYLSRVIYPSFYYRELEALIKDYLLRIADYVGIEEGPLSIQLFYHGGKVTVGEVAGRFFGKGQGIVPVINGIDMNKLLVNMLYFPDENREILAGAGSLTDHASMAVYLKAKPGIVRDTGNVEQFRDASFAGYHVFAQPGQSTSFTPWLLRVYARFDTRREADEYAEALYRNLYIPNLNGENLVAANELTKYEE